MLIGIGCDIVEVSRIYANINSENFLQCILTEKEYAICNAYAKQRKAEWIAGRFAAKEAIYKAINTVYACPLTQIEILSDVKGRPFCTLSDFDIKISIAHEKAYAIAYAIAYTKE